MLVRRSVPIAAALALSALGAACDSPTEPTLHVVDATLEAVGDATQLEARVTDSGDLPRWESLNEEIVTVTEAGMAVGVAPGTATVRARIGSRTAEGTVTVLPPVDVRLSDLTVVTDEAGHEGMRMRLANAGGRGYYRLEYWRERATPEGEHQRVLYYGTDADAAVGMNIVHESHLLAEPADWVIVYSRQPHEVVYAMTGCARIDGGAPCPMP